jgi:2-polyprenyl-3-methyl-5-hydroxy-6-metoxy-1,4-benzoquinol methylase
VTTRLHEDRLAAVQAAVTAAGAARVLDLGCGDGELFLRLAAEPAIARLVGVDIRGAALDRLRARLARAPVQAAAVELRRASLTDPAPDLAGFDCAALVETIEHVPPGRLSALERAVFHGMRPGRVVVTTPNAEFNPLLGVPAHRFRHPDHRFEWPRATFRAWGARVGGAAGYDVRFADIAGCHPDLGGASQMAVFTRAG